MRAESFAEPPPFPIPDPAPTGVTLVTDVRAVTSAGPVLVDYMATNRFLSESELRQLPAFNYAVERSLAGGPLAQTNPQRHIILGLRGRMVSRNVRGNSMFSSGPHGGRSGLSDL